MNWEEKFARKGRAELRQLEREMLLQQQEDEARHVRASLTKLAQMAPGIRRSKFWRKSMRRYAPSPTSFAPWFIKSVLERSARECRIVQEG